jgi:3-phosphoshikimate 1-carboxyvinyltransferase
VEMTAKLITAAGGRVEFGTESIKIEPAVYVFKQVYTVPLDATAASYYAAWAISTQRPICICPFVRDTEQGDWRFLDLLERLGMIDCMYAKALKTKAGTLGEEEETATLTLTHKLYDQPIEADFREISDTFLTLLAIGPLLKAPIKLYGLKHTRFQECDRLRAIAHNLKNLGQNVIEGDDGIELWPDYEALKQKEAYGIEDYGDHRVAMSFAILGSHDLKGNTKPWIYLRKPELCAKTFPDFFKTLERMHQSA